MAADPALDHAGLVAGRYDLREPIGHGGMGEVRAAWDTRLERPVAIKTLRSDVAAQPSARRRFETEARSAARLVHPNVVSVYDSGEDRGIPFMVMELLPGRSLRDEIAEGPMPVGAVQTLASQVLGALAAAHEAGIVHRDIKPANILVTENGHWKVTDFGIAKSVEMQGTDDTVTGMILGTPAYLAPERLFGGDATPAGDLYSLGVILYEALVAHRPFHADSPEGWAAVIAAQEPEPLLSVRPDVPAPMAAAITRSITRDPAGRFGSAAEMAAALGVGRDVGVTAGAFRAGDSHVALPAGVAGVGAFGWHEVRPAAPAGETTLVAAPGRPPAELLSPAVPATVAGQAHRHLAATLAGMRGLDHRRRGLAAVAAGTAVAAIVGISVAGGAGGASPATTTHKAPASTLPPTTLAPTTLAPTTPPPTTPPPPPRHHDGGGPGGGKHGGD